MRWAKHVTGMGEMRNSYKAYLKNLNRRDHLEDPGIGGRIILKWIMKQDARMHTRLIWLRIS
jgi:hypothetical protein